MAEFRAHLETLWEICSAAMRGDRFDCGVSDAFADVALPLAERHRVVSLLAAGAPAELRDRLRRRVLALAQQTVRLEHELAALAGRGADAGIGFLVLKGPALARQAYAAPEWRSYDDLDLWVESTDLPAAVRVLEQAGYRRTPELSPRAFACARRAGIDVALRHPESGRLIELSHGWRALAPSRAAACEMVSACGTLALAGSSIRVLSPVHSLLFACAHGAHHRWDRLGWVADVAGLWSRLSPSEREEAWGCARRWGMETRLEVGLRLADDPWGGAPGGPEEARTDSPRAAALVDRVKLGEIGPDSVRAAMAERLPFECDAQDSAWRRWQIRAGWIFRPTLGDVQAVALPAACFPLYWIFRPLRLLFHPWRGDWKRWAGRA